MHAMKIKRDFYLDRLIKAKGDWFVKIEQETRGLRKIGDSFRKIVVVDGVQPFYTDESGVSFVSLMDFMLNRDVLG